MALQQQYWKKNNKNNTGILAGESETHSKTAKTETDVKVGKTVPQNENRGNISHINSYFNSASIQCGYDSAVRTDKGKNFSC